MSRVLLGTLVWGLALVGTAAAQETPFHFDVTAAGIVVSGSITAGGTTYSAEQIEALASEFLTDSTVATRPLPSEVIQAVVALGGAMRSLEAGGTP